MIRNATPADSSDLATLHALTWQQAYAGLMPQAFLDGLGDNLDARAEQWRSAIAENSVWVLLDYNENALAGFAAYGKCRDKDTGLGWGELGALYYLRTFWGSGRAQTLCNQALDQLKESGSSTATLWVLEGNARAIAFYQQQGFAFDGQEKSEQKPGFTLREHRMTKRLAA